MKEVAQQMDMSEWIPDRLKSFVRDSTDSQYRRFFEDEALPTVRNRHEAFGYIVERMNDLGSSQKGVKSALGDCESMLSGSDISFINVASNLYDQALGLVRSAMMLAIFAQNTVHEMTSRQPLTPLEEMSEEMDLIDEDLIDDEMAEEDGNNGE